MRAHRMPTVCTWKGVKAAKDYAVGVQVEAMSGRVYTVVEHRLGQMWETPDHNLREEASK